MDIQFIPRGRGAEDKKLYGFVNWFLRRNKKIIREKTEQQYFDLLAYGYSKVKFDEKDFVGEI